MSEFEESKINGSHPGELSPPGSSPDFMVGFFGHPAPRTRVELTHRNCAYQITISGGPLSERRRIAGAVVSLIAQDSSLEIDDCSLDLYRACHHESS